VADGLVRQRLWAHRLCWIFYLLLLGGQGVDAYLHGLPWIIWLGKLLPLLIFLPGMLRQHLRSYIWLCFVTLLYFIAQVERMFAQPGSPAVILGMVAVVGLFVTAMLYVRWRARELKAQAVSVPEPGEPDHE